jgi:hypothetical protein
LKIQKNELSERLIKLVTLTKSKHRKSEKRKKELGKRMLDAGYPFRPKEDLSFCENFTADGLIGVAGQPWVSP